MTELLTAAQIRAIEQAAIASGEVTGLELMERAGRGVVEAILDWRPELATTAHRAVVLCGPGNNGGDGFVVARLLKQRGWEVGVFLYGDEAKLPPDAAENCRRWREMGEVRPIDAFDVPPGEHDLTIDALFGTGLARPLGADLSDVLRIQGDGHNTVSVDLPSGICSDSGRIIELQGVGRERWEQCFFAQLTVTFHCRKIGHLTGDCPAWTNCLKVCDIGIAEASEDNDAAAFVVAYLDRDWIVEALDGGFSPIQKYIVGHKYHHGHALILSGGVGKGGAARLAARGALRIGAGLVTVGCPPAALQENAAALDAIMLAPVKGVEELRDELRDRKINAVCIGPGFGTGERLRAFVAELLGATDRLSRPVGTAGQRPTAPPVSRASQGDALPTAHPSGCARGGRFASARGRSLPSSRGSEDTDFSAVRAAPVSVVLDADALTEYRDDPETLFAMLHQCCVLTPHQGEFGRLFPDILAKLTEPATKGPAYSKVDATREAAARAGCVVLFKGADTVIAAPDGRCAINSAYYDRAAPWLATAGSGDVLAGFITGLLARGLDPMAAAETAAWLHVEAARKFGPGLIAEDLPEQLPAVFRDLGL